MVLSGLKLEAAQLVASYGPAAARRMFAASLAAIDCVEQIVSEEAIDCDFRRSGHLLLAHRPAHFHAFAREFALLRREFAHPTRLVPPGELRDEIGSGAFHGGLVDEASAGLNLARFVAGLGCVAVRAGAQISSSTRRPYGSRARAVAAGASALRAGSYAPIRCWPPPAPTLAARCPGYSARSCR